MKNIFLTLYCLCAPVLSAGESEIIPKPESLLRELEKLEDEYDLQWHIIDDYMTHIKKLQQRGGDPSATLLLAEYTKRSNAVPINNMCKTILRAYRTDPNRNLPERKEIMTLMMESMLSLKPFIRFPAPPRPNADQIKEIKTFLTSVKESFAKNDLNKLIEQMVWPHEVNDPAVKKIIQEWVDNYGAVQAKLIDQVIEDPSNWFLIRQKKKALLFPRAKDLPDEKLKDTPNSINVDLLPTGRWRLTRAILVRLGNPVDEDLTIERSDLK